MNSFDRLHPLLLHHVVNSLGWRELRPLQEACILPILEGENLLLLAPTAGGKTEAAVFPLISQMLQQEWKPLSVVYLCPIKALLNNLGVRLSQYCQLVGLRSGVWHGDIAQSDKKNLGDDPPDFLLTTPESLQVLLVSRRIDHHRLFKNVRVIVADELHAFAGDDRGWQMQAVIELLSKLARRDLQRLGLSATVGNPDSLLEWYCGSSQRSRQVLNPSVSNAREADVQVDFVGSLSNAALVISRLHQGEKRLVFSDSRSKVEQLAVELRLRDIETFVSHSSLSASERKRAEEAFAERSNCVIAATSTLELGIDVGDLDKVIQLESPSTVSSFLQRLGRTGRREGAKANCLFLSTRDETLLQAVALLRLWERGFVEPIIPPRNPWNVLVQQVMCLVLQERGLSRSSIEEWLGTIADLVGVSWAEVVKLIEFMLSKRILFEESGVLSMGDEGEKLYGSKNFMELFAVFDSPPLFSVLSGREELGLVHEFSFWSKASGPTVLSLAGRSWEVVDINWKKRTVSVRPSDARGSSVWLGDSQWLSFELCQAIREVLASDNVDTKWSSRVNERMEVLRQHYSFVEDGRTTFEREVGHGKTVWWTFVGGQVNAVLSQLLSSATGVPSSSTNLSIIFEGPLRVSKLQETKAGLLNNEFAFTEAQVKKELIERIKFNQSIPPQFLSKMIRDRLLQRQRILEVFNEPMVIL